MSKNNVQKWKKARQMWKNMHKCAKMLKIGKMRKNVQKGENAVN
jgi:hypothetical protein